MRLDELRVERQRRLVLRSSALGIICLEQNTAIVHPADRVVRVLPHRLRIDDLGSLTLARRREQPSKIQQVLPVGRLNLQNPHVVRTRL